jgi:uncharacterized membrane protein YcaP (DUF421 family)
VFAPSIPLWEIVLRTAVVYAVVLGLLRLAGKRELGQMSAVDLVVILIIANAVQNAMNGGDVSLVGGLVAAATLVAINFTLDRFGHRIPVLSRLVESSPTLLLQHGELIPEHLERENITREDIEMAAREHGIDELAKVSSAILEVDGSISIIPRTGGQVHRTPRRLRQMRGRR